VRRVQLQQPCSYPDVCCCILPPQMEQIKAFRQWESMTPGHPENFVTPGVEVTTGEAGFSESASAIGFVEYKAERVTYLLPMSHRPSGSGYLQRRWSGCR
jgi:hypothetical protein